MSMAPNSVSAVVTACSRAAWSVISQGRTVARPPSPAIAAAASASFSAPRASITKLAPERASLEATGQLGRASVRARVWKYVLDTGVTVLLKKKLAIKHADHNRLWI